MCDDSGERRFMWANTIYGREGRHRTPYMTRWLFGRLRVHLFHRGDLDPDCHDHPWDFWTFPLTDYIEEVRDPETGRITLQVVRAFRLHRRSAEHAHRVLGPVMHGLYAGHEAQVYDLGGRLWTQLPGRIWTVVLRSKSRRLWGFWRDNIWVDWRTYVYGRAS